MNDKLSIKITVGGLAVLFFSLGLYVGVQAAGDYYGYFKGQYDAWGGYVMSGGISATSVDGLVSELYGAGGDQNGTGARFILDTMGVSGPEDLRARLNYLDAKGQINWTGTVSSCRNSYYQGTGKGTNPIDDAFYNSCRSESGITITNDDGSTYMLVRRCGNPIGSLSAIDSVASCDPSDPDCTSSTDPEDPPPPPPDPCDPILISVETTTYPSVSHTAPNGQNYYYPQTTIPILVTTPHQNVGTYYSKIENINITAANTTGDAETVTYAETSNHISSYTDVYRTVADWGWVPQSYTTPLVCPKDPNDETPCTGGEFIELPDKWMIVSYHQEYDHTDTNYTGAAVWTTGIVPCYDYSLTANVSSNYYAVEADALISVGSSIGSGSYTGKYHTHSRDTQWQLVKLIIQPNSPVPSLGNSNSSSDPCGRLSPYGSCSTIASGSTIVGTGGWSSSPVSLAIGDYLAGTKVCFAFGVQPRAAWHQNHIDSQWNHSSFSLSASCIIVVKKPRVQIWGSDLWADKSVTTSTSVKILEGAPRTFGSWAEYGILAGGSIIGMASGSAFAAPLGLADATVCKYSTLSFTNSGSSTCSASTTIGGYVTTRSALDVAASFSATGTTISGTVVPNSLASGTYTSPGDLTIGASELAPGKSIIIKASGTVTIAGNQTYSPIRYTAMSQLPQLVIVAGNIVINDAVTNVDAWLIAKDGMINTCASVGTTAPLSVNLCNLRLNVNGPVIAKQLWLRRTAGAGIGLASGDPAEIFNLRADAYLWSVVRAASSGRIQTVYSTELPPRF